MINTYLSYLFLFIIFNTVLEINQLGAQCNDGQVLNLKFERIPPSSLEVGFSFCYNVSIDNFNSVNSFQFALAYDTSVLELITAVQIPGSLTGPLLFSTYNPGVIHIIWTNANSEGQSVADNTDIFTLCFNILSDPEDCSPISFCSDSPECPNTEIIYIEDNILCTDTMMFFNNDSTDFCFTLQDSILSSTITLLKPSQINIYPNPVSDNLYIDFDVLSSVSIYNIAGKQVYFCKTERSQKNLNIDLIDYPNGTYIMKAVDLHNSIYSEKFVVRR